MAMVTCVASQWSHLGPVFVSVCLPAVLLLHISHSCCFALKLKMNRAVLFGWPLVVATPVHALLSSPKRPIPTLFNFVLFFLFLVLPYLTPMSIRWGRWGWQREERSICVLGPWGLKTICCWLCPLQTRAEWWTNGLTSNWTFNRLHLLPHDQCNLAGSSHSYLRHPVVMRKVRWVTPTSGFEKQLKPLPFQKCIGGWILVIYRIRHKNIQ